MLTLNVPTFAFSIFQLIILFVDFQIVQSVSNRNPYRVFRGKGTPPFPPLPPALLSMISPPSRTSPPNFHNSNSDYDLPPFLSSPPSYQNQISYDDPSNNNNNINMEYGPPPMPSYGPPTMKPVIVKHVYVHVPPPEPDLRPSRPPLTAAPPQKHYKIVFIKAPSAPTPTLPTLPVQLPDEEKTLVYVLVKKPDELPELVLPKPPSTQPSKPEVYFIRYKAQKEENGNGNDNPYPPSNVKPTESVTLGPPLAQYGAPPIKQRNNGYL